MLMKKILLSIALVLILITVALLFVAFRKDDKPQPDANVTFPTATTSTNVPVELPLTDGSTVRTRNFIQNGTTIEDPANEGNYYLQGTSGACRSDGSCLAAGTQDDFSILYFEQQHTFSISLNREPLGEVRREAETYLKNALGISESEMCKLKYTLGTTGYVNQTYGAIDNLGFSFCPGSVQLPY